MPNTELACAAAEKPTIFDTLPTKTTEQEAQAILEAAGNDAELVAALVELLNYRIEKGKLSPVNLTGLMLRMLKNDDHAAIKQKGQSIADSRFKAEQAIVDAQALTQLPAAHTAATYPIEALMAQDNPSPAVAKLQAKLKAFLEKKEQEKQKQADPVDVALQEAKYQQAIVWWRAIFQDPDLEPNPVNSCSEANSITVQTEPLTNIQWLIDGILPLGLVALSARPGTGKTWLGYRVAIAVTAGKSILDNRVTSLAGSPVTYFDFQTTPQDRQAWLAKMGLTVPEKLRFTNTCGAGWPLSDNEGKPAQGLLDIEAELQRGVKLVIIDTSQNFFGSLKGRDSVYDRHFAASKALKDLAEKYSACILLMGHSNAKGQQLGIDAFRGNDGIVANCNAFWTMTEDLLQVDARGNTKPVSIEGIRNFPLGGLIIGANQTATEVSSSVIAESVSVNPVKSGGSTRGRPSDVMIKITQCLRDSPGIQPGAISANTGIPVNTVRVTLYRMKDVVIRDTAGKYALA